MLGCAEALNVVTLGVASVLALGAVVVAALGAAALYCVSRATGLAADLINSGLIWFSELSSSSSTKL